MWLQAFSELPDPMRAWRTLDHMEQTKLPTGEGEDAAAAVVDAEAGTSRTRSCVNHKLPNSAPLCWLVGPPNSFPSAG